ncbi:toprim domain-containing protein [Prevotella sp. SGI.027]
MSEQQVDFRALKAKVGIDDVAYSLGYQLDRKAGVGRYIELVLPDVAGDRKDTIIISHVQDKSQQTFFRRNGQRGDVINFIEENANAFGVSSRNKWDLISKVMSKFANEPIDSSERKIYGNNMKAISAFDEKQYLIEPIATHMESCQFIFRQRNIKVETVKDFSPWIDKIKDKRFENNFYNIGFPYRQPGLDKIEGYEIRGYGSFKRKATGTNSTTAAWIADFSKGDNPQSIKQVFFAESAYDIMAFYQFNKTRMISEFKNSVFVSIGGTFSNQQISSIMDYYSNARAVDCFDNDIPGRIYGMRMVGVVEKIPLEIIQKDKNIILKYQGKEYEFDAKSASLNNVRSIVPCKREYGMNKAPSAFKDWNDVIMNKPSSLLLTKSKYEREDNLRTKRMGIK